MKCQLAPDDEASSGRLPGQKRAVDPGANREAAPAPCVSRGGAGKRARAKQMVLKGGERPAP